jgi:hypothetical protein
MSLNSPATVSAPRDLVQPARAAHVTESRIELPAPISSVLKKDLNMRLHVSTLLCGLLLFLPSLSAQDAEVKSVRISLKPQDVPIERVTIENRRNSPLVFWDIGLSAPGASRASLTHYSDRSWPRGDDAAGDGPIKPNARRVIDVDLGNRSDLQTVALRMVVFADGFCEGAPGVLAAWRAQNDERADDLAYWVRAIDAVPRDSAQELRRYFVERASERARQVKGDPSGLRYRMTLSARSRPQRCRRCWPRSIAFERTRRPY